MNILFYLGRYPGYGGIEKVTTILANYFVNKNGWSVSIISHMQECADDFKNILADGIKLYYMPNSHIYICSENQIFLNKVVYENDFDYIVFQDSYSPESLLYGLYKNIPIIVVEHNTPDCYLKAFSYSTKITDPRIIHTIKNRIFYPYFYMKIKYIIRKRHAKLYKLSYKYVLLSEAYKEIFTRVSGINNLYKISVINNPLTVEGLSSFSNIKKEQYCVFVGRLVAQKGIVKLMDIWSIIEKETTNWKLVIIGDGDQKHYVEDYIKRNQIKNIVLTGYKNDVSNYLQKSSLFLMTSIYEGWPLTLAEAMSNGCVPVAFNTYASVRNIIDDGINGLLVEPFDSRKYADAVISLIEDNSKRNLISKNAIKKASNFSVEIINEYWKCLLGNSNSTISNKI